MTILTIILVLFIDRVLWHAAPYRQHTWFLDYSRRLQGFSNGSLTRHAAAALLIVGLPLVLLGWIQLSLLPAFGPLFELLFGGLVLLLALGPFDLGRSVDAYLQARRREDAGQAAEAASALGVDLPPAGDTIEQDPAKPVAHAILRAANHALIAPLFWFVLFGPVGAMGYRLAQRLRQQLSPQAATPLRDGAGGLAYVFDWAPARLTALGFAVGGNFDAVTAAWKHCSQGGSAACPNDDSLLEAAGMAALEQSVPRSGDMLVQDATALTWRSLTLWVMFFATASLLSL